MDGDGYPFALLCGDDSPSGAVRTADSADALSALLCESVQCREWLDGRAVTGRGCGCGEPSADSGQGGLCFCLTTKRAYALELAGILRQVLTRRLALSEERCDDIELAIHEAVANAILHGNLGISSVDRQSFEGLMLFAQQLEEAMADPVRAERCLEIRLLWTSQIVTIIIADQGDGYVPDTIDDVSLLGDPVRKTGRGLLLIRSIAAAVVVSDGGRTLAMEFAR